MIAAALVLAAVGATWGTGVFGALTGGGFDDPDSESSRAHARITEELGSQDVDVLVLYSSPPATVDDPAFRDAGHRRPWTGCASGPRWPAWSPTTTRGARTGLRPTGTPPTRDPAARRWRGRQAPSSTRSARRWRAPGVTTEVGGLMRSCADANTQIETDITRAEMLSLPILLVLLVFIFRGLVAAATPLLVGVPGHPRRVHRHPPARHGHRRLDLRDQHHHAARPGHGDRLRAVRGEPVPGGVGRRAHDRRARSRAPSPPPAAPSSSPG